MENNNLFEIPNQDKVAANVPKYCTVGVLSDLLGIYKKQISNLKVNGVIPSEGENKFLLEESVKSYCKYIKTGTSTTKAEMEAAKLEKVKRENMLASGELVYLSEITQFLGLLCGTFVDQMDGLAPRNAAEWAGITDQGDMQTIVHDETRRVLRTLSGILEDKKSPACVPGGIEAAAGQIDKRVG